MLWKITIKYLLSRYWINHCYNRLHNRDALQALHDPQGDLHRRGTSFSEIQIDCQIQIHIDLQETQGIIKQYVCIQVTPLGPKNTKSNYEELFADPRY